MTMSSSIISRKFIFETIGFFTVVLVAFGSIFVYIGYLKNNQASGANALQGAQTLSLVEAPASPTIAPPVPVSKGATATKTTAKKSKAKPSKKPVTYSAATQTARLAWIAKRDSLASIAATRERMENPKPKPAKPNKTAKSRAKKSVAKKPESKAEVLPETAQPAENKNAPVPDSERVKRVSRIKVVDLLMGKW